MRTTTFKEPRLKLSSFRWSITTMVTQPNCGENNGLDVHAVPRVFSMILFFKKETRDGSNFSSFDDVRYISVYWATLLIGITQGSFKLAWNDETKGSGSLNNWTFHHGNNLSERTWNDFYIENSFESDSYKMMDARNKNHMLAETHNVILRETKNYHNRLFNELEVSLGMCRSLGKPLLPRTTTNILDAALNF